ncbi:RNA-binding protein [Paracidovorax citrulli]
MALMMLSNLDGGTTDEEIVDFLKRYGFPPHDELAHFDGDGSRPSVQLTYGELDAGALRDLRERIHGMFWKGRRLSAIVLNERFN